MGPSCLIFTCNPAIGALRYSCAIAPNEVHVNSDQARAFRLRHRWSIAELARLTGLGETTIKNYERGQRAGEAVAAHIPKHVELAYAALEMGIRDFDGDELTVKTEMRIVPKTSQRTGAKQGASE